MAKRMTFTNRQKAIEDMVKVARQRNSYQQEQKESELYMAQSYLNGMGRAVFLMTGREVELRVTPQGAITKIVYGAKEYDV